MKIVFLIILSFWLSFFCSAQTADEIITKHITTIGGAAAWDSISTSVIEGIATMMTQTVNLKTYKKAHKSRQEINVMGMSIVTGFDGTTAWILNPLSGNDSVVIMNKAESESLAEGNPFEDPFINYKQKQVVIALLGNEKIGNENCYIVQLTKKNNSVEKHYISATTFYVLKTETKQNALAGASVNGKAQTVTINYSNYKKEGNVVLPHTIAIPIGDMTLTKVTFNVSLADTLFAIPSNK